MAGGQGVFYIDCNFLHANVLQTKDEPETDTIDDSERYNPSPFNKDGLEPKGCLVLSDLSPVVRTDIPWPLASWYSVMLIWQCLRGVIGRT